MDLVVRRVLKGLGANAYGQFVTVAVQLVGVPILLHAWGAQMYGEWLMLSAIPAYLSMSDLGFSQSAANDMTARAARGDRHGALVVFQSLAGLVYATSGLALALSTILVSRLPLQHWLHFQALNTNGVRWVLWFLAAEMFVRLPNGVTHAGFRACGEYGFHMSLDTTTKLIQAVAVWATALLGGGPIAAAAAFCCVRALSTPALTLLLVRRHRWLTFGFSFAQRCELRRLSWPALANIALPLAQALNIQGMVIMVGAVLGPISVVVFSTLRTLTRLAVQLVLSVCHATEPEIAATYGDENHHLMRRLFVHTLRSALWLALAAAAGLVVFGRSILAVWTGGKVTMEPTLFAWLLASAVATVLWYSALVALRAINKHVGATIVFVAASSAAVAFAALLLVRTNDVANAGAGLLLMDAIMVFYTLPLAARALNVRPAQTIAQAANPYPTLRLVLARRHVR